MADDKLYVLASDVAISEQKSNDIFLLVEMRILSTQPNGNAEGVTPQFIDEIVANPEKYACLPLYVDVDRLLNGDYLNLGHMYDAATGLFGTKQIGSITLFRKEDDEQGTSLIAEGRIPKREADICCALMELYHCGKLNFSFEIKYVKEATVEKDGVMYVDKDERNALTGVAVVSVPAYKESVALSLVAEKNMENGTEAEGVENKMTLEEAMASLAEKDALIASLTTRAEEAEKKLAEEAAKPPVEDKKDEEQKDVTAEKDAADSTAKEDLAKAEATIAERDEKIAQLEASCEELKAAKAELETLKQEKAAAELAANQAKAKTFAQKQGLDVEDKDVSKAIAELNYQAIAEMCMANDKPDGAGVAVASIVTDGFEMKGGKYDDLLAVSD